MSYVEDLISAHNARLARFAEAAKHPKIKNRTITHVVPVKLFAQPEVVVVPVDLNAWAERQKQNYKTPWFEIMDGPCEFEQENRAPPKIEKIQAIVCEHFVIDWRDMLSKRRTADITFPRMVAVYLCRRLTIRSTPELGRRFGHRNHATILHSIRKISRLIGENAVFAAEVEYLRKKCEAP